jgi:hypothetical protein
VSGYLARLVARAAIGLPAGAVGPRLGPLFPLGPNAPAGEPGFADDSPNEPAAPRLPTEPLRRRRGAPLQQPSVDSLTTARRPPPESVATPRAAPARAPGLGAAGTTGVGRDIEGAAVHAPAQAAEREGGVGLTARSPETAVEARIERVGEPKLRTAERDAGPEAQAMAPVEVGSEPRDGPATSVARPRSAPGNLPPGRHAATPPRQAPRIEVRIGRVEVRKPPGGDPVQGPAPATQERVASGFDRLAAARRYVDRQWS